MQELEAQVVEKPDRMKPLAEITPALDRGIVARKFEGYTSYRVDNAHIDARRYFAAVLQEFEKVKTEAQAGVQFRYKWSEAQAAVIRDLVKHAINDHTGTVPVHKGWYLWGDFYIGKTTLARALQAFHQVVTHHQKRKTGKFFKITDVRQMFDDFKNVERPIVVPFLQDDRLFDDVGVAVEQAGVKVFGEPRDIMAEILWGRHNKWVDHGMLTYFTSNLPFDDVKDKNGNIVPGWIRRFDERLQARLREMIVPIYFPINSDLK